MAHYHAALRQCLIGHHHDAPGIWPVTWMKGISHQRPHLPRQSGDRCQPGPPAADPTAPTAARPHMAAQAATRYELVSASFASRGQGFKSTQLH
jgi:hypothetical protein